MVFDPAKHNRISIRIPGYDYSQPGLYYITICIQNRICLLGKITDKKMILNDAGKMIEKWYFEMENKYPNTKCREYVVMPNHIHFIIEILDDGDIDVHREKMDAHGTDMVGWFKTMTTNEYIRMVKTKNWPRFNKRLWQLRYWDWVVRGKNDYARISNYIRNNPAQWEENQFKP